MSDKPYPSQPNIQDNRSSDDETLLEATVANPSLYSSSDGYASHMGKSQAKSTLTDAGDLDSLHSFPSSFTSNPGDYQSNAVRDLRVEAGGKVGNVLNTKATLKTVSAKGGNTSVTVPGKVTKIAVGGDGVVDNVGNTEINVDQVNSDGGNCNLTIG